MSQTARTIGIFAQPMSFKQLWFKLEFPNSKLKIKGILKFKLGWLFYVREAKLKYFFSNTTWLGILKESSKMLLHDLKFRPFSTLFFFFFIKEFQISFHDDELIVINGIEDLSRFWISRQAILGKIRSQILDETIDYDFFRNVSDCEMRIWATSITPSIFTPVNTIQNARTYQAPELESNTKKIDELQLVEFYGATVHHGKTVSQVDRIVPLSIADISHSNSWPSDSPINFHGKTHLFNCPLSKDMDEAIFLGTSTSWYHFIVEYLPRYLCIPRNYRNIPILIPQLTPPQLIELLSIIGFKNIIFTESFELINLKKLTSVLDFRYANPFDFQSRRSDLLMLQEFFASLKISNESSSNHDRILILRSLSNFRQMRNSEELCRELSKMGFVNVYPEKLSFVDQLTIFRNAKIIVAQSGAALTSLLFNNKDSLTFELGDWDQTQEQFFWRDFAHVLGIPIRSLYAKRKVLGSRMSDSFNCDINQLKKQIQRL